MCIYFCYKKWFKLQVLIINVYFCYKNGLTTTTHSKCLLLLPKRVSTTSMKVFSTFCYVNLPHAIFGPSSHHSIFIFFNIPDQTICYIQLDREYHIGFYNLVYYQKNKYEIVQSVIYSWIGDIHIGFYNLVYYQKNKYQIVQSSLQYNKLNVHTELNNPEAKIESRIDYQIYNSVYKLNSQTRLYTSICNLVSDRILVSNDSIWCVPFQ